MKILAIGDLHGKLPKGLPKDVAFILLTGDLGKSDLARKQAFRMIEDETYEPSTKELKKANLEIYNSTVSALKKLRKIAPIFFVDGNVEMKKEDSKEFSKKFEGFLKKHSDICNINGKIIDLEHIKIAGYDYFVEKEWIKRFRGNDKEYLKEHVKEDKKARKFFSKLKYVNILLVHQPPYKILDKVKAKYAPKKWKGKHAGSEVILSYIKRKNPSYVFCGHIHESSGIKNVGKTKIFNLGERNFLKIEI